MLELAFIYITMFKTVKVGNTSLQYTIVSQSDDTSTVTNGSITTPALRKSKIKRKTRHRKTVILILITLIMGCGIVIAAVLVPILVASKLVSNLPESAKFKTFAIAAGSIQGYSKYDQSGHKYVELLPIKQPPVDAVIEFQDEIPVLQNTDVWSADIKLKTKPITSTELITSAAETEVEIDKKLLNSSKVTVYFNVTENKTTTELRSEDSSMQIETPSWRTVAARFLGNLSTLMIRRRIIILISLGCVVVVATVVGVTARRKRKSRPEKIEPHEHRAQRKQLLTAIPIEED